MAIDPKLFRKNLTYSMDSSVTQIISDLEEINQLDILSEREYAKFDKLMWQLIIVGLILIFAGLLSVLFLDVLLPALVLAIGCLLLLLAIYPGIMAARHGRLDIPNYRYNLSKKIIEMLNRDLEDSGSLSVSLVFSPPTENHKFFQTIPHPRRSGWKIRQFTDEWLKIQGEFLDKTEFLLTATEFSQISSGWKTSRSGKSKHKSKTKSKGLNISLTLDYPLRKYGVIKIMKNEAIDAVKLPDIVRIKKMQVTDKRINLTVKVPPKWADNPESLYKTIAMMYLSLYQVLNLARLMSKKQEA